MKLRRLIREMIIEEIRGGKMPKSTQRAARRAKHGKNRDEKYKIVDGDGNEVRVPWKLDDKRTARKALKYVKTHHDRPKPNSEIVEI